MVGMLSLIGCQSLYNCSWAVKSKIGIAQKGIKEKERRNECGEQCKKSQVVESKNRGVEIDN